MNYLKKTWKKIKDFLLSPINSAGERFGKGASQEITTALNQIFDEKIDPLADKLDFILKERIKQAGDTVKEALGEICDIEKQLEIDIGALIDKVDAKYKDNLKMTFDEINESRAKAFMDLRKTIGEIDTILENRINHFYLLLMKIIQNVERICKDFTPGAVMEDLVKPTSDMINAFEKELYSDIDRLIDKIFDRADISIEKLEHIGIGLIEEIRNICRAIWNLNPNISEFELYQQIKNRRLKKLKETTCIDDVIKIYGALQLQAKRTAIVGKNTGLSQLANKDFVEYGIRFEFWSQVKTNYSISANNNSLYLSGGQ